MNVLDSQRRSLAPSRRAAQVRSAGLWHRPAGGSNYQSMINEALRSIATEGPAKTEMVVRRVVREELKRVGEPRRSKRAKAA
jgi:hypothetical protein